MSEFIHLPKWASDALDDYEQRIEKGEITFREGEFADIPAGTDGYLKEFMVSHLCLMDITPHSE